MNTKTYQELITIPTFKERLVYLQLGSSVGDETFGSFRWLNQTLYRSKEWKDIRNTVILRDNGCDLALPDRPIFGKIYIHHLNPISVDDVRNRDPCIFDTNNLVCVSFDTHQMIHYGINSPDDVDLVIRSEFDTCPWRSVK
jgi:hypothetical protein